jgi:hypothetical protein
MQKLMDTDLLFLVGRLPRDVIALVKKYNLIVAGGFIRSTITGERVSDIDIFGKDVATLKAAAQEICIERKGSRFHETDNAFTVLSGHRIPLQFITRWLYDTAEKVIPSFDFTVCQAALEFTEEKWHGWCSERFYPDLAARRLYYTHPVRNEDAGGSMMRVKKFLQRGYTIQAGSLGGVIARLVGKIEWEKIWEWEGGEDREQMTRKVITGLLREVDPLTVVDGVDLVDEHEVL